MNISTPVGNICIQTDNSIIIRLSFSEIENKDTFLLPIIKNQICEYFEGKRKVFQLSYKLIGTEFQKKVWTELLNIPYGCTKTYKEIAVAIGNQKSARAVGNACNKNPLPIIIPCHRVVGSDGKLTGYNGGMDIKEFLLLMEKKYSS